MCRIRTAWIVLAAVTVGCGDNTGPDPQPGADLVVVGLSRQDLSPVQDLSGHAAAFFDRSEQSFLEGVARVNQQLLNVSVVPGFFPGPVYIVGARVDSGRTFQLFATIQTSGGMLDVVSAMLVVPAAFGIQVPGQHPGGQPMEVSWDATPDAEFINVAIGSGFVVDLAAGETSFTVPAMAFAGLAPGTEIEVEVTAYNGFYVPLAGIATISNPEEIATRFTPNVDGALGVYGTATTVGSVATLQ